MSTGSRSKDKDRELSEILQEAQLLRTDVLQRAQREARHNAEPLWRLILREGLLSDEQLFRALKQYVRVPVLAEEHLENVVVPAELRQAVAPALAQQLGILPLERSTDGRRAALAMLDPTLDLSPLWPALSKLGVAEVRRFLLNLQTLRRGMQMFYGQAWQADASDASLDGPTPPPSRSAVTQPIPRPVSDGPSVMVDPQLQAEIAQLSGSMLVPELSGETAIPVEAPTPPPVSASRQQLPISLMAILPSGLSARGEAAATSQTSGRIPASPTPVPPRAAGEAVATPSAPITPAAPAAAAPIEPVLEVLEPTSSAASSRATPLRELSGPRAQAPGRTTGPIPPSAVEQARAAPGSTRSGQGHAAPLSAPSAVSGPTPGRAPSAQSGPSGAGVPPRLTPTVAGVRALPRPTLAPPLPATTFRRPPTPSTPIVLEQSSRSGQSPLPELSADIVVDVDEDRSGLTLNRSGLRVPTVAAESSHEVAQDAVGDALMATCEALVATLEKQLRTTWPTTLARLAQGVGDRLGFAPRAVRELMLMARLRGVLRAELMMRGPLPPVQPTLLGYATSSPIHGAAQELQKVLVDFMRLPQDENEPLGVRILHATALALDLHNSGLADDALLAKLREQAGDTDVVFHVHKALALDPPQLEPATGEPAEAAASRPPAPLVAAVATAVPLSPAPSLHPLPPRMPAVPWRTVWTLWPMSDNKVSDEDLLPYTPTQA